MNLDFIYGWLFLFRFFRMLKWKNSHINGKVFNQRNVKEEIFTLFGCFKENFIYDSMEKT